MNRPPEPLRPCWLALEDRRHEIQLALDRYSDAGAPPCPWWLIERGVIGVLLLLHPRYPRRFTPQ
jgi:hypothetical protein